MKDRRNSGPGKLGIDFLPRLADSEAVRVLADDDQSRRVFVSADYVLGEPSQGGSYL
jgi:hypothetical protein